MARRIQVNQVTTQSASSSQFTTRRLASQMGRVSGLFVAIKSNPKVLAKLMAVVIGVAMLLWAPKLFSGEGRELLVGYAVSSLTLTLLVGYLTGAKAAKVMPWLVFLTVVMAFFFIIGKTPGETVSAAGDCAGSAVRGVADGVKSVVSNIPVSTTPKRQGWQEEETFQTFNIKSGERFKTGIVMNEGDRVDIFFIEESPFWICSNTASPRKILPKGRKKHALVYNSPGQVIFWGGEEYKVGVKVYRKI